MAFEIGKHKDGSKMTNVEIVKVSYNALKRLRDATPEEYGEKTVKQMHNDFVQIAGMTPNGIDPNHAENVFKFYESVANAPDYNTANKMLQDNIFNDIKINK